MQLDTYYKFRNLKQACEFWLYVVSLTSIGFGIAAITQKSKKTLAIIALIISSAIMITMFLGIGYFGSSPSFSGAMFKSF